MQRLEAYSTIAQGLEDESTVITLKGLDTSQFNRTLSFQLLSLPKHGILRQSNGKIVSIRYPFDDTSVYPYSYGIKFEYIPDANFFNEPRIPSRDDYLETFEFVVLASSQENGKNEYSAPANVTIEVLNVNDPPVVSSRIRDRNIYPFSSLTWDENDCIICKSKIVFYEPIKVLDPDRNFDFVRVDVTSSHGILTLKHNILNMTDFTSCSNRTSIKDSLWNCKGSPTGDKEVSAILNDFQLMFLLLHPLLSQKKLTFLAKPFDIMDILANMTYESFYEGQDQINMTIYDGVGGQCLSPQEHKSKHSIQGLIGRSSVHIGCTLIQINMRVNIIKPHLQSSDISLSDLPVQLVIAIGFASIVGVFIIYCYMTRSSSSKTEIQCHRSSLNSIQSMSSF